MAQTATQLRSKSENLMRSFQQFSTEIKRVNADIVAQISANEKAVEELKTQHEFKLAQLYAENEQLNEQLRRNSEFCEKVDGLFANTAESVD